MYLRLTKRMVQFIQETMLKFMVPPMVKAFWMTLYRSNQLSTRGWAAVLKDAQSEKVLLSFKKCAKLLSWALLTHLRRRCSESCFGKFFWGSRQSEKNNVKVNVVQVITYRSSHASKFWTFVHFWSSNWRENVKSQECSKNYPEIWKGFQQQHWGYFEIVYQ